MTRNQILYQQNVETNRSNLANENLTRLRDAETQRSHYANEAETKRSNLAREFETNRHNVVSENETHRSNLANELLKNAATEELAAYHQGSLSELNRSNLAKEIETNRSNVVREIETERNNRASISQQQQASLNQFLGNKERADAARYSADIQRIIAAMKEEGLNERQVNQIWLGIIDNLTNPLIKAFEGGLQ